MTFINTHELGDLEDAFRALPEPAAKLVSAASNLVAAATEVEVEAHGINAKLNFLGLRKFAKQFGEKKRIQAAAWNWLRPLHAEVQPGPAHLKTLQQRLDLDHLPFADFVSRVGDECAHLATRHPRLARYFEGRRAALDFAIKKERKFAAPPDLYQRTLIVATARQDHEVATRLVQQLLSVTAAVFRDVLDDEPESKCVFDANLMVPIAAQPVPDLGDLCASHPYKAAAHLWEHAGPAHGCFAIVAGHHAHGGFWIPDVRNGQLALPGGPEAFRTGACQAVFVDDLPTSLIADHTTRARWVEYLSSGRPHTFAGEMFVSAPIHMTDESEKVVPVGVVNINVHRKWKRAYSRHWLNHALEVATPWLTQLWYAFEVAYINRVNTMESKKIDSVAPTRLLLGGALLGSTRLLPAAGGGGDDER